MEAILVATAVFQFVSALLSFRFVSLGRLGRPWLLVSVALLLMGGLTAWELFSLTGEAGPAAAFGLPVYNFVASALLASGFFLTELWFRLRERLEARFRLIAEVDRGLVGLLDEGHIVAAVCDVLSRGRGCRAAWIGTAEEDGTIRLLKAAGAACDSVVEALPRWDESPAGNHPAGIALRKKEPFVANGFAADPRFAAWKDVAARGGYESVAAFPLEPYSHPRMVLTVCAAGASAFDRLEVAALDAMAHRVGTALQSARRHEFFVSAKAAYDDLLRSQRDGVILVRGGKIVRANPAAFGMLGYAAAHEIVGLDPAVILDRPELVPETAVLVRAGEPGQWRSVHEVLLRRRDGSTFAAEVAATWVPRSIVRPDLGPALVGPLGMIVFRDITLRRQALEDLRRERDFSARILDIAGLAVAELDPCGRITAANRQFEGMLGFKGAEAAGRLLEEFLAEGPGRDRCRRAVAQARAGRERGEFECAALTRWGEERILAWTLVPGGEEKGAVRAIIAMGSDVTERRRLERQVVEMQKMEAVGVLAGGIAHDFNNILTGVIGNLDLALRFLPANSGACLPLHDSIRAAERAARLVRQLLEFSRKAPLERRAVRLGKVVNEVVHLFSQTVDRRIVVETYLAPGLWPAAGDSNQIHQVLMNLLLNARDAVAECLEAAPPEEQSRPAYRIQIRAGNFAADEEYRRRFPFAGKGDFVRLSVSDNGRGMDEETKRRVFEPFFTTKALGRGTGLGLSTVYGIVKQHGGWVTVESALGRGSTFCVFFPRAEGEPEEERPPEPERPRSGKETILFADDEEMIREVGRRILEAQGYTVLLASDGREALDIYSSRRGEIDLVVLDQTMPGLSGSEVLERILEIDPAARVILSSGYLRRHESFREEIDGRAAAFLQKPYRPGALARAVRDVLDGRGPA